MDVPCLKRKAKCSTDSGKRLVIRNWTTQEESEIANYLVDKPYLGKDQAKETQVKYDIQMLEFLNLKNCDVKRLRNKITAMKKKYEEVRKWIGETGQGVQEENPESFPGVVIKMCHYYYTLDEILATSQAINASYQRHEGEVTGACDESTSQTEIDTEIATMDEAPPGSHVQDVQLVPFDTDGFLENHPSPLPLSPENTYTQSSLSLTDVNVSEVAKKQNKFSKYDLTTEREKNQRVSAVQKLAAIFNSKCEGRQIIEEKKLAFEQFKWEEESKLRRCELEEARKLELEKIKLQSDAELERIKLQKDSDLEKIKIQNDAELEKIKIQSDVELQRIQLEKEKLRLELFKLQSKNIHFSLDE